jgi:hypothetical protein
MSEIRDVLREFWDDNVSDMSAPMMFEKAEQSILEWARKQVECCEGKDRAELNLKKCSMSIVIKGADLGGVYIKKSEILEKFSGGGK